MDTLVVKVRREKTAEYQDRIAVFIRKDWPEQLTGENTEVSLVNRRSAAVGIADFVSILIPLASRSSKLDSSVHPERISG